MKLYFSSWIRDENLPHVIRKFHCHWLIATKLTGVIISLRECKNILSSSSHINIAISHLDDERSWDK